MASIEQKKYNQWILTPDKTDLSDMLCTNPEIEINATKEGLEFKGYGIIPWKDLQEHFDQSWTYTP